MCKVLSVMEIFKFKGMPKSNSDSKLWLSDRLNFSRRSKQQLSTKSLVNSPLPPRPTKGRLGMKTSRHEKACDMICENIVSGPAPSLHSPRYDPGLHNDFNSQAPLLIKGIEKNYFCFVSSINVFTAKQTCSKRLHCYENIPGQRSLT